MPIFCDHCLISRRGIVLVVTALCLGLAGASRAASEPPVLFHDDFEKSGPPGGVPKGWSAFSPDGTPRLSPLRAHSGRLSVRLVDRSRTAGIGLRSPHLRCRASRAYRAEWWYFGKPGRSASFYIEFWNAGGARIQAESFPAAGTGAWHHCSATATAPPDAVALTVLFYSASSRRTEGWFDDVTVSRAPPPPIPPRGLRPPAAVQHPCGLYQAADIARARENIRRHPWARNLLDALRRRAAFWLNLPPEKLAYWIPARTPFRVVDCPKCGAGWRFAWKSNSGKDRLTCRKCGFTWPNPAFRETRVEKYPDPAGGVQQIPYYAGRPSGEFGSAHSRVYRLSGRLRWERVGRLSSLGAAGMVYALTGETRYAAAVRRTLLRLAEVYPHYLPHDWGRVYRDYRHLQAGKLSGWKYMDEMVFIQLAEAYDLTVDSGVYSDADKSKIEEGCFREFLRLMLAVSPRGACINDGITAMTAAVVVGRILGNSRAVRWALEPPDGLLTFLRRYFRRDGHWYEASPSYELMSIGRLPELIEALRGWTPPPDLASQVGAIVQGRSRLVRKIPVALARCVMPDGFLPPTNDSTFGARYPPRLAETAAAWDPSPANQGLLAWVWGRDFGRTGDVYALFHRDPALGPGSVAPRSMSARSDVEPGVGWAILRTPDPPGEAALFLDYGPKGSGHGHDDRLNISFYDYHRELVTDLGYLGWGHPNMPWMHSSAAHNHVIVDGRPGGPAGGRLEAFCGSGPVLAVEAAAPQVYDGVTRTYRRRLVLLDHGPGRRLVVDCFEVRGGRDHQYAFHADGDRFQAPALKYQPLAAARLGLPETGYRWMRRIAAAPVSKGPAVCTWTDRRPGLPGVRLVLLPEPGSTLVCAEAPGLRRRNTPFARRTLHVVLLRHPGPVSHFLSVFQSVRGAGGVPGIQRLPINSPAGWAGGVGIRFPGGGGTAVVLFASDAAAAAGVQLAHAGKTLRFHGRTGVVEWDAAGRLTRLWLMAGTRLRCGQVELRCTAPVEGRIRRVLPRLPGFELDAPLPFGKRLSGDYAVVMEETDGAYRIAEALPAPEGNGCRIRLAGEPILHAHSGERLRIVPWAALEFLPNGVRRFRGCAVAATWPATRNGRLFLATPEGGWRRLPGRVRAGDPVRISLSPVRVRSIAAVVSDAPLEKDHGPPRVLGVIVPGCGLRSDLDAGYLRSENKIEILVREDRALDGSGVEAVLAGNAAAAPRALPVRVVPGPAPGEWTLACRLPRSLARDDYRLRLRAPDQAFHVARAEVRFTTRGLVQSFRDLDVTASSGRLCKWLASLDTRFYRAQKPGDWVEFGFNVPRAGLWDITLAFTRYSRYGIAQMSIDGRPAGKPVDFYGSKLEKAGGRAALGRMRLAAGRHRLRCRVLGKNPKAAGYYLGLCRLILR